MLHQPEFAAKKNVYYPAFDYLRIILATTVAAFHAGLVAWPHTGSLAVQIFFALSGWLIGGILLRSKVRDLPRFYFNRSARIWIPYFVAIGLLVSVSLLKDTITQKWLEFIIYKFTFVYDLFGPPQLATAESAMPLQGSTNHFWSICAEEQFYLIAPLTILFLPIGRSAWLWLAIFALAMISPFWELFSSIALGVAAVCLKERFGEWHRNKITVATFVLLGTLIFCGVVITIIPYRIGAPVISICVVLSLARPGGHSKTGEYLGGISYPMYLNHWLGMFLTHSIFAKFEMRESYVAKTFGVLFAIGIAAGLYQVVDKKIRNHRDLLYNPLAGTTAAATGYTLVVAGLLFGLS